METDMKYDEFKQNVDKALGFGVEEVDWAFLLRIEEGKYVACILGLAFVGAHESLEEAVEGLNRLVSGRESTPPAYLLGEFLGIPPEIAYEISNSHMYPRSELFNQKVKGLLESTC